MFRRDLHCSNIPEELLESELVVVDNRGVMTFTDPLLADRFQWFPYGTRFRIVGLLRRPIPTWVVLAEGMHAFIPDSNLVMEERAVW